MKSCPPAVEECPVLKQDKIANRCGLSKQEAKRSTLSEVLHGDLYIIGRIWIKALKKALVGSKMSLIPVVHAAKITETPPKPPRMKYTDLPLYKSPHYEYKDYEEDKRKCPEANVKLLHRYMLPYVKYYRKQTQKSLCNMRCIIKKRCNDTCQYINRTKSNIKNTMRDPANLEIRQAVLATGTLTGYMLGRGGGISRRIFCTSLGFLSAGAICFPKETDEIFRTFTYYIGKAVLAIYNSTCNKNVNLRERIPCNDDVPNPPPNRKPIPCPQKK